MPEYGILKHKFFLSNAGHAKAPFIHHQFIITEYLETTKLRAVAAEWRESDHTAIISFYFDGPITDEDADEVSDLCGGIIAYFADGLLEKHYIRLDSPQPLPLSKYFAYQRDLNNERIR